MIARRIIYYRICILTVIGLVYLAPMAKAQSMPDRLYHFLCAAATDSGMHGNLLIATNGQTNYQQSFGYRNIGTQSPNTANSLFPLASISKTFTAVAILQLYEKKKLQLDDPYALYFPAFPWPVITIRQLLSHTSGLPDSEAVMDSLIALQPDKVFTNADVLPALIQYHRYRQLPFQPGERWGYSSIGYNLLANLVEKLSKQPFAAYMQQHIFLPAGMLYTYVQTSLSQTKEANRTVNYQYNTHYAMKLLQMDTAQDWKEWTYNSAGFVGAGNVVSTTGDLLLYDQALYNGKLLHTATLEMAFTPVKLNNGTNNLAVPGTSYGLGWFIFTDTTAGKIVWHSGANPGVTTLFARNLTTKQTVIVLQNVSCPNNVYTGMLNILRDKPLHYTTSLAFRYGQQLYTKGADVAASYLLANKTDTAQYSLTEAEMDRIGLEFTRYGLLPQALEAYKLNVFLFPQSWHTYDSYAGTVWRAGKKEEAIWLFQQSLALNPNNDHAKKMIEQYGKERAR